MIPILDNGHGGMIGGSYQTKGKRSPDWNRGILYEGMFNRWVVNRLIERLDRESIPYHHASPEMIDVGLGERVSRANKIHGKDPNVYLLSIHANAGGGTGIEGFTSKGETKSDEIAQVFLKNFKDDFEEFMKMRFDTTDGDFDKEEDFYVLRNTNCPAVLIECGFMDHHKDYEMLWSESYADKLVDSLIKSIKSIH